MRRCVRFASSLALAVVFLSSCATTRAPKVPYFDFQAMGEEGVIVVTVDAVKEQEMVALAFSGLDEFARRAERVSLSLKPGSPAYPLEMETIEAYGVIKGDYPKFLINTGMLYASELEKQTTNDGVSYFTQKEGPISLHVPKRDTLLFTNASYEKAYERFDSKQTLIDLETALSMADASLAVYALEPSTFFDLGLDLPDTVITQAKVMLLLINRDEQGLYSLDAFITMDTPKLANTLSQMVRTGYLARLKREKVPYKISDLMKMFLIEDDLVTIKHMELGEEQMALLKKSLTGLL
ncbi:MAG: hypothetical protein EOM32_03110 [Spirochaetia bacterium]|nr:hypothetical protein [Spirochaetia bacterium]NCC89094.1 hypothetical protein [Spirochaetia bacterium]